MKTEHTPHPPAGCPQHTQRTLHRARQRTAHRARRAAAVFAAFLSGCGPAASQQSVETSGYAEMVIAAPGGVSGPMGERLASILGDAGRHRVHPNGSEGSFGSVSGGWTFRRLDSESSERAELYFYELFPNSSIMGSGDAEPVARIMTTRSINPNFNVVLQPSEYTSYVGSDVFIMAAPGLAIFYFLNQQTGQFDRRAVDLDEMAETSMPLGALTSVVYKQEEKLIEAYYISEGKAVVVQFSLLTTNTSARPVE